MNLFKIIEKEAKTYTLLEKIFFPLFIILAVSVSIYKNDSPIALLSALCGISYTILAGKGKIFCFFTGLIGSFCYVYLAIKSGLYGNAFLYGFYYIPMQIIGIFNWKKHLKKESFEIVKTSLSKSQKMFYIFIPFISSFVLFLLLRQLGGTTPFMDAFTVVLSIAGQLLTVRRCIEQWYFWFFVNLFSVIMWINAVLNGSKAYAVILMWIIYLILSVYFFFIWKKEMKV